MFQKTGRTALLLGAALQLLVLLPYAGQAHAQYRDGYRSGWDQGYQVRQREDWERRERADYCMNRYGNYDRRNDTYRGSDGYSHPCR